MKKKDVINLIRYFAEKNEAAFKVEAYKIAKEFEDKGDSQLSQYIVSLLSGTNTLVPQELVLNIPNNPFWTKLPLDTKMLLLPESISADLRGIANAIIHNMGLHKFLFVGDPGTGKTEAVKQLGRILERTVLRIEVASLVDSKLGQTSKNLQLLAKDLTNLSNQNNVIVLFDEIDMIAMDRTNSHDVREMGRVTSAMLSFLDEIDERIVVVGTSNLHSYFDKAFLRRFDSVISFDKYTHEDLVIIGMKLIDTYLKQYPQFNRNMRLVKKILEQVNGLPMPGELNNIIRTALAFSNPEDGLDYIRRLYILLNGAIPKSVMELKEQGYTVRDIEVLIQESKSTVSRKLKQGD
ncbi:MAG: ATP-binding protein [Veillonella sp.]|uniref:ATP-binding protein n=1 Tax=Veillonella sp. TaxID=1926307 RepID=UPI002901779D|nr:ATP-binding protein [Veillonella sp.]MDU2209031.1 ATP-binding protein [Veillonella sp.]MDU3705746.1 ATP-binding protein [Veillonella sp.]